MAIKVAGSSLQTDAAVIANFLQNGRKFCITTPLVFIEWEYTFSFSWEEWTGKMNMSQIFFAKCQKNFRILVLTCHMIIIQQNIGVAQIPTFFEFHTFSKCTKMRRPMSAAKASTSCCRLPSCSRARILSNPKG